MNAAHFRGSRPIANPLPTPSQPPPEACPLTLLSTSPLSAAAVFPSSHPAFHGHFPGNPILPGFLSIQMALDALRLAGLPHQLVEVSSARFLAPILPGAKVVLTLQRLAAGVFAGTLAEGGRALSTFTIHVA